MTQTKHLSNEVVGDLRDHRAEVAIIIQKTFFPWPPTRWETMPEHQQRDFLECADEIFADLRKHGWKL
jgi:hypothetical protein